MKLAVFILVSVEPSLRFQSGEFPHIYYSALLALMAERRTQYAINQASPPKRLHFQQSVSGPCKKVEEFMIVMEKNK